MPCNECLQEKYPATQASFYQRLGTTPCDAPVCPVLRAVKTHLRNNLDITPQEIVDYLDINCYLSPLCFTSPYYWDRVAEVAAVDATLPTRVQ